MSLKFCAWFIAFLASSAALAAQTSPAARSTPAPLRVLLVAGGCCHDYTMQPDILKIALEDRANVVVTIVRSVNGSATSFDIFNSPDWAKNYDLILHDECSADVTDATVIRNILAPHAAGLPAVMLHCAEHSYRTAGWNAGGVTPWFEFTGLQSTGHGAQLPIALNFIDKDNDITKGMANWTTANEELYNNFGGGVLPTARALVRGTQGNTETTVVWTNLYKGKARVFATTLGHNNVTVQDPRYLNMVTRGLLWAANKLNSDYLKPVPTGSVQYRPLPAEPTEAVSAESCGCQGDLAVVE